MRLNVTPNNSGGAPRTVTVIGGGVAGMSAACALAEAGYRVQLVERRGYLGGRASSYLHPGVNEVIDNCQHVLFGCCTNLIGFYRRIGVADRIHWTSEMTMIEPGGRRSVLGPSSLPAPLHGLAETAQRPRFFFRRQNCPGPRLSRDDAAGAERLRTKRLAEWLRRHGQTHGAIDRFWRLVIASALNADLDVIAVPYAAKVIRELFMNSARAGSMGMSTVPLERTLCRRGRISPKPKARACISTPPSSPRSGMRRSRSGRLRLARELWLQSFSSLRCRLKRCRSCCRIFPPLMHADTLAQKIERFEHWPICSVHLWFDRKITDLPHAVLLDREIHWMYNKSRLQPWRKTKGSYLELVVSASRSICGAHARRSHRASRSANSLSFFLRLASAKLEKAALVKEVRATFGVPPGIDAFRPPCFRHGLTASWPATGSLPVGLRRWKAPSRSGHMAADAVCASVATIAHVPRPGSRSRRG